MAIGSRLISRLSKTLSRVTLTSYRTEASLSLLASWTPWSGRKDALILSPDFSRSSTRCSLSNSTLSNFANGSTLPELMAVTTSEVDTFL